MSAADPLHALASPRRRAILRVVWDAERSAGEIHRAVGEVTFGAVSQHLAVLREAGLVTRRSAGRQRLYRARPEGLGALRVWLEAQWNDALTELGRMAELEEERHNPPNHETR